MVIGDYQLCNSLVFLSMLLKLSVYCDVSTSNVFKTSFCMHIRRPRYKDHSVRAVEGNDYTLRLMRFTQIMFRGKNALILVSKQAVNTTVVERAKYTNFRYT